MNYYLAIDIGASSGRHILGHQENGKIQLEEIYRFENGAKEKNGHLCWDLEYLFSQILEGLKRCRELEKIPVSVGIDTWGIDYVLLDANGQIVGNTVAYRDKRTAGMDLSLEEVMPFSELYQKTGIQKQLFNTVYQLLAHKKESPDDFTRARHFLMIPDYFHYRLTGDMANEYTNATTTALINAQTGTWDPDILRAIGVSDSLFMPPTPAGTTLGAFLPEIEKQVGFSSAVVLPATHDTGSAFLAVPAKDESAVYLSSGTWSLLGVERNAPLICEAGKKANFTNEGGYEGRFRYLKNIMGLWMIQSIRRETEKKYSFAELEQMAREAMDFPSVVNVDAPEFLAPKSMIAAVENACKVSGQPVPTSLGEVMQCVYRSLATCYRDSIEELSHITGQKFSVVHIVGGGSKDTYLNAYTAKMTGLPVLSGPTEGTALGNLMVQMRKAGEFPSLLAARASVRASFPIQHFTSQEETL